jgi:hypothetical protein
MRLIPSAPARANQNRCAGADQNSRIRRTDQRDSALALVPAGFLVLIILGALAVDSAAMFLGQRQLGDATAAAANDAAGAAVDNAAFYRSGVVTLDPAIAGRVVCQALNAQASPNLSHLQVAVAINGNAVGVRASARVSAVFGHALPDVGNHHVSVVAVAYTSGGTGGTTPPPPNDYQSLSC